MVNQFLIGAMNRLAPLITRRTEWGQSLFAVTEPNLAEAVGTC